jgi:hypothetical protein
MEVEKVSRLLYSSSFDGANSAAERQQMNRQGTTLPLSFKNPLGHIIALIFCWI